MKRSTFLSSKLLSAAFAVLLVLTLAGPAVATSISFDQGLVIDGELNYSGALGDSLFGTNITFATMGASGTAADGIYTCSGCVLNFQTGPASAQLAGDGLNNGSSVTFGAGGSFVLLGEVLDNLNNPINTTSNVLLTGSFNSSQVVQLFGSLFFIGTGIDVKNSELMTFLGLNIDTFIFNNSEFGALNQGFGSGFEINNVSITDADLTNSPVPEPSTLLLSGLALLGLGLLRRRQSKA